ncbi:methyltransferase domain-containing protein [Halapricum sp. CBA1109]|nr:methyltransferase domain-containing protein [Halapricum sp. CBA1109]
MTSRERVVEYPYVYNHLDIDPPSSILVAGGARSPVAYTLASMGYETTVVDLDGYELSHRNLTSRAADFTDLPFDTGTFDAIISVSVIEHVGMYSEDDERADIRAFEELTRVLSDGGELLFTTPFAKTYSTLSNSRVYSWDRIQEAIPDEASLSEYQIYAREEEDWFPVDRDDTPEFEGTLDSVLCAKLLI